MNFYNLKHTFLAQIKKPELKFQAFKYGAGNEIRTRDPDLGKVVLYQLSYSRKRGAYIKCQLLNCQASHSIFL